MVSPIKAEGREPSGRSLIDCGVEDFFTAEAQRRQRRSGLVFVWSGFGPEYQPEGASPRSRSGVDLGALRVIAAVVVRRPDASAFRLIFTLVPDGADGTRSVPATFVFSVPL